MIKLYYAPTSPYVRKVMAVAHELDCVDQIELLPCSSSPVNRNERVAAANPLAKIPAAVTEEGEGLFDSRVICEYLADRFGSDTLFPTGPARWLALKRQAMGDGLLDAALLARYERNLRPAEFQYQPWYDGQIAKIHATLDAIDAVAGDLATMDPDIGSLTLGCALGYLDFRFGNLDWRQGRPSAAAWFTGFDALPSMRATRPRDAT